jgi:large conductance mechanosensitive channel
MTLDALKKAGVPLFAYGSFLTITLNFVLLAFIIFQMVKIINRIKLQDESDANNEPPPTPEDIQLLREIRDSLKNKELK